jgi:hypothetical protein
MIAITLGAYQRLQTRGAHQADAAASAKPASTSTP